MQHLGGRLRKHVVFGRVIDGLLTVRKLENVTVGVNNKPKLACVVAECGQVLSKNIVLFNDLLKILIHKINV